VVAEAEVVASEVEADAVVAEVVGAVVLAIRLVADLVAVVVDSVPLPVVDLVPAVTVEEALVVRRVVLVHRRPAPTLGSELLVVLLVVATSRRNRLKMVSVSPAPQYVRYYFVKFG